MEKFGLWIRRIAILALTCLLIQGVIRMIMQYFGWPPYDKPLLIVGAAMVLLSELIKKQKSKPTRICHWLYTRNHCINIIIPRLIVQPGEIF